MPQTRALLIGNTDGIGLALTRRLLAAGYQVQGVSRRASSLVHERYEHTVCDVTSVEYGSLVRALLASSPPVALCVYCVGIGELLQLPDLSQESRVFCTNLLGLVETTSAVVPALIAAGRGHLIGLSSIADQAISMEAPSYAASKAGVSSYLESLAHALRPHGVYVSNVRFGFVETKMAKSKVRPLMISVERAVDVLMSCIENKPARLTYPRTMDVLVRVLRWLSRLRLALR
jgi:short-subunit dehydrogenase